MTEENNKKKCPFCGAEINANAKKCRFCDNWIDEEIECPFCAEKIKASAKKCRFCGEWLPDNPKAVKNKKDKAKEHIKFKFDIPNVNSYVLIGAGVGLILVCLLIVFLSINIYVPKCKSNTVTQKLKEYLVVKYPTMGDINILKNDISTVKKNDRGYTCSAAATIDDVPTHLEYSYKKVSMNDFNFDAKIILPNCYDNQVKQLLVNVIKDVEYLDIKNIASDVTTAFETVEKFDKNTPSYQCTAETTISAKPGKAFRMNYWNYDDATRQIKCKVDYKTYLCENGFTTCVGVKDVYSCDDKED